MNREWNAEMTQKPCFVCGYKNHVQLCHIKPITTFPESAILGEVNHPSNIVPLCSNHHWELNYELLKPEQLFVTSDNRSPNLVEDTV
jgi:hypothetical protein